MNYWNEFDATTDSNLRSLHTFYPNNKLLLWKTAEYVFVHYGAHATSVIWTEFSISVLTE